MVSRVRINALYYAQAAAIPKGNLLHKTVSMVYDSMMPSPSLPSSTGAYEQLFVSNIRWK